jgi:hypothetical protein
LGVALVLVGIVLLAFQVVGRGLPFGVPIGSTSLVDQTLPGNRIELTASSSDVEVRTWSGSGIHIEAIQHGGSRGDYNVDVTQSGDTVRVSESARSFFCLFCARSLSYRISVPSAAQAEIKTASGDSDIAGLGGAVKLTSVSGDVQARELAGGLTVGTTSGEVELRDVAGRLDVSTISGDVRLSDGNVDGASVTTTSGEIQLRGVAGALDLSSISGDITVQDARDGRLTVSTTSGGLEYTGSLARGGTNTISSISGDVELRLPEDSSFSLDASTVSGELSSDFDLRDGQPSRRELSGTVGEGEITLKIETTSGNISVER